jgi:hypothetical protein
LKQEVSVTFAIRPPTMHDHLAMTLADLSVDGRCAWLFAYFWQIAALDVDGGTAVQ